jgi:CheY-like chemotaxis protein
MKMSRGKILVVEDDPASYQLIAAALKSSDYEILHSENGKDAMFKFNENIDIRLVLMDIQLPEVNGFEILEQMKGVKPYLPIVAQTAYSMTDDREKCLNAGCDEYMSKPISIVKLREMVKKYMD